MNASLSWLKAYVPELDTTAEDFFDKMTLSGSKVEGYEKLDADLDKIIIGQIKKIDRHPDADKLVICMVDIGEADLVQIVTGAPNVFEGAKVPVVLHGGRVAGGHDGKKTPGGIKITKGKLRGVESNGMLCSIEEMGSSKDMYPEAPDNGIYIFGDDAEIGANAVKALGLDDVNFEFEITSNRIDCFSIIGIAREAAATYNKPFCPPVIKETGNSEDVNDYVKVKIEDETLCKRYTARVVKNVKIAPSPVWMQRRLASMGIRPINNLVDITNYVMEEYGQPMHAYDLATIAGNEIIVRRAADGETFYTLDGQERKLDKDILMICDHDKAVGIGGIMGGQNSMITDQVETVLFEAANFDGTNIRLSSKRLGLRTDASGKFEKGLDPEFAIAAINRACELVEEFGAGEVVGGTIDCYPNPVAERRVAFDADKINALLGTEISKEDMLDYLAKVELFYDDKTNEIIVPTFRVDVEGLADIAEEVARFYGYDNIPTTLPKGEATLGSVEFAQRIEALTMDVAEYNGFSESMTYSFESPKVFDKLLLDSDSKYRNAIKISNPLGEDYSIMRTIPLNGMLTSLSTNYNRRNKNVKLYELANTYLPEELPLTKLPDERKQLVLGLYGDGDFFTLKGVVEEIFAKTGLNKKAVYSTESLKNYLHPGRQAEIVYDGIIIGYLGEVHPEVLDLYEIGERAYVAVIDMKYLIEKADFNKKYEGIAKYPAVSRDLSMLVSKDIPVGEIEAIFDRCGGKYMESYELFDIYEGSQISKGFKSVAYNIVFRASDKTLEEADIASPVKKILKELEKIGVSLRA